ncbi:WD-domain-containing protein [Mycena indigotica]|uniref:WD-domain-containing protein n=1 Tax=Mycena indigotica TaxID=2126181 RepID=A0A8H6VVG9_9AGAR|nr:WD-domain-containing protein [Mycena indigotica]KAF7295397.1 WD-domain-containing protein [Mycena indigotica]
MRFPEQPATPPQTVAGPSSLGLDHPLPTNGVAHANGFTNGATSNGAQKSNGHSKQSSAAARSIARVALPGTSLYPDDSNVDREEFVRLVIQSLRDVGYHESAATLEAESGYSMESPEVAEFRRYINDGLWSKAENALIALGVGLQDPEHLPDAKFLINQQKYLELLEAQKMTDAVHVLRNEIAPLGVETEQLHLLSRRSDNVRQSIRTTGKGAMGWRGRQLETNIVGESTSCVSSNLVTSDFRHSSIKRMLFSVTNAYITIYQVPQQGLLSSPTTNAIKLLSPRITTTILEVHTDQVWMLEWSRDGNLLASSSNDKLVIIWGLKPETETTSVREWEKRHALLHQYPVICMAWSLDDSILLAGTEHHIKMWNTETGVCVRTLMKHTEPVTSLVWLPDKSGFFSAGMDFKIYFWACLPYGSNPQEWSEAPIRVASMVLTPDCSRFVVIGMKAPSPIDGRPDGEAPAASASAPPPKDEHRMLVFDYDTKHIELDIPFDGELTSLSISRNSQYVLINRSPDDIQLWDINTARLIRRYTGQRQSTDIIRSCFGGFESNFIVSGSEDSNVYVWHRDTGVLLEVLEGHGEGSVNCVAWNPRNERMFASCSDDHTIRIWESADVLDPPNQFATKSKGKTRQHWEDGASGSSSLRT